MITFVRWSRAFVTACFVAKRNIKIGRRAVSLFITCMDFSSTVTVPQTRPDRAKALWEQLVQDGFSDAELKVPPIDSVNFAVLMDDSKSFSDEISAQPQHAWPLRCERWLNRLSTVITGKLFTELPATKRRAICHAAVTLADRPELLA